MSEFSRHVYNSYKKLLNNNGYYIIGSDCDINILELLRSDCDKAPPMPRVNIRDLDKAIYNSRIDIPLLSNPEIRAMASMIDQLGCLESVVNKMTTKLIEVRIK